MYDGSPVFFNSEIDISALNLSNCGLYDMFMRDLAEYNLFLYRVFSTSTGYVTG